MPQDPDEPETLEQLIADRVGRGRQMTWRQFEEQAVDEESGHRPSRDVLWKIGSGKPAKINRQVVGAIAAGLGLPPRRVQIAAAYQLTGLRIAEVEGGLVLHESDVDPEGPLVKKALEGREESDE